jgi:hypothetical protein
MVHEDAVKVDNKLSHQDFGKFTLVKERQK